MTNPLVPNPLEQLTEQDLRRRSSIKWREHPPDVLPLWVAEMDVTLAAPVAAALNEAVALGDTGYPVGDVYAEALAGFTMRRWSWSLDPAAAKIVPDVMLGVVEVLKLVTDPGDAVVINTPVYPPFFAFVGSARRRVLQAPLGGDHRLDLDVIEQAYAAAVAGGGRAAHLLCNPHNPTGTVHTVQELTALAALAARYGVRVIADEIHAPLVMEGAAFVPYLTVRGAQSGFSLMSASKGWNLAGLKAAVAIAGEAAAGDLARIPEEVGHGASHLGVLAHAAALRDGEPWLEALLAGLDENRRLLAALLAEHLPQVRYRPPSATYLAWLDCRELGLGDDAAAVFLERGRVALLAGPPFGLGGAGHVRLNLATSKRIITDAVRRMAAAA